MKRRHRSEPDQAWLSSTISGMSPAQLAGQRLMIGFDGHALETDLEACIPRLQPGGIILFACNLESPEQIRRLCTDAQACAARCGLPPLLIAVDQEGGQVARLKPPFSQFGGNPAMRSGADAERFGRVTAAELNSVGINMDMAPVMDVAPPDIESVMRQRVFTGDAHQVATMGCRIIETLQSNGIMAVAKHFPGIGRTVLDSHLELPDLETPREALAQSDFIPFQAAIQAGVAAVMLSHIRYTLMDPRWPASLSPAIAGTLLRDEMRYDGLVITDDLDMGAIRNHYDMAEIVHQMLRGRIDMALICHRGPHRDIAHQLLEASFRSSDGQPAAYQSVRRILSLKQRFLAV
jgi:beta-N-acetylhexosaminidase